MIKFARLKLGSLCSVVTKGTTPTSLGMKFEETGVPFLRIQNLNNSTVSLNDVLYISEETHNSLGRSKIKSGDFLITIAGTIGRVAIVPNEFPEANCNQAIAILRFDELKLYPRYLLYWITTNDALSQISGKKVTATISNLSLGQIKELEIPLPPLEEQKRIAAILDKADAIRRKRQQAIQLADDFLRSVFLDMFGDPVTNPKGWEVNSLKSGIEKIESGWSAKGESYPCGDGEKGVLKISSVTSGTFKPSENKYIDSKNIPENRSLVFPIKGDLLFSRANTRELVAATCIVPETRKDVFLPDKLWKVKTFKAKLLPEFLHFMIQHPKFKNVLTSQATGTSGSMLNISKSKFEESLGIFPPLEMQKKFQDIFWKVNKLNASLSDSISCLDINFSSLSHNAFAGEL